MSTGNDQLWHKESKNALFNQEKSGNRINLQLVDYYKRGINNLFIFGLGAIVLTLQLENRLKMKNRTLMNWYKYCTITRVADP